MIQAQELRIGNWFLGYNGYSKVIPEHFEYLLDPQFAPHKAINPIPLTPEILARAGFIQSGGPNDYVYDDRYVMFGNQFAQLEFEQYDFDENGDLIKREYNKTGLRVIAYNVNHLHQLQNLYYALSGEELIIDLK